MAMSPRLLRPLASGFNPRSISGLALWLDAADGSTLFQNSDGTTPATATSDPVGYWGDKSGNGRHATQATAASRPTISATTQNGRRTLGFDGTNDTFAAFTSDLQPSSIFAVVNCSSSGAFPSGRAIIGSDTSDRPLAWIEDDRWEFVRWGQNMSGPVAADLSTNILTATNDGTTSTLFVNGGGAVTDAGGTFSSGALTIGAATDQQYFAGFMAEILVYDRALTATQRQKVEGWLAWRWGLEAQLPYDHPYARSFPGFGSQTVPTDADTLTYLAAVKAADGTGVEVGVANAVDAFVTGCKSDGIWDSIKASCILAGARTLAGALVPLRGSAPTNNNFAEADYNRETGLVGDGSTTYLDSNRANDAENLNDQSMGIYLSALGAGTNDAVIGAGTGGTAGASHILVQRPATVAADTFLMRSQASAFETVAQPITAGLVGMSRAASGSFTYRVSGAAGTSSLASNLRDAENINIFARGIASPLYSTHRAAFYWIGESLSLSNLDARVSALITAIGAAL